jgi:glucosamine-6-phosphate deaminase
MTIQICDTSTGVAAAAADLISEAIVARPGLVLGLPTGQTPIATYAVLRGRSLDWSGVRTFNLDEFVGIAPGDPRSYRAFMQEHLFEAVNLQPAHVHFLDGAAPDLEAECRRYDDAIAAAGGIDFLVCGVGQNGHVAFNEPGPGLRASTHVATLLEPTRRANAALFGGLLAAVPAQALTIGMATILQARRVIVLATGTAKAAVVAAMHGGPLTTSLPASWLQVHAGVELILDRDAASALTG